MTENLDWNEIDKILREIENIGRGFLFLKDITPLYIDLWRWDAPETAFWWIDSAGLNKMVAFTVDRPGADYSVRASGRAWLDNRETLKRKWVGITFTPSLEIGGTEISDANRRKSKFSVLFEVVFQKTSAVKEKDLVNTASLQPMPWESQ